MSEPRLNVKEFLDLKAEVYKLVPEEGLGDGEVAAKIRKFEREYFSPSNEPDHFRSITFGGNKNYLINFMRFAVQKKLTCHFKEIHFSVHNLYPLDGLENLDSEDQEEKDIESWGESFSSCVKHILTQCPNLESILLEGFMGLKPYPAENKSLLFFEKQFVSHFVDSFNRLEVRLPNLQKLSFRLPDLWDLERFWQVYGTKDDHHLTDNMSTVKTICYCNPYKTGGAEYQPEVKFFAWIKQLKLEKLEFIPDQYIRTNICVAPLALHCSYLRSLQLKKVDIKDSFSRLLNHMRLECINLDHVTLNTKLDRWVYVFQAINKMNNLKQVETSCLRYDYADPICKRKGMCSRLPEDRYEYLKLHDRVDALATATASKVKAGHFCGICYCVDDAEGIYSERILEDTTLADSDTDSDEE